MTKSDRTPRDPTTGRFQAGAQPGPGRPSGRRTNKPPAIDNELLRSLAIPFEFSDAAAIYLVEDSLDEKIEELLKIAQPETRAKIKRARLLVDLANNVLIQRLGQELKTKQP